MLFLSEDFQRPDSDTRRRAPLSERHRRCDINRIGHGLGDRDDGNGSTDIGDGEGPLLGSPLGKSEDLLHGGAGGEPEKTRPGAVSTGQPGPRAVNCRGGVSMGLSNLQLRQSRY